MPKNTQKSLKIALVVDDGLDRPDGVQQYVLTLGSWFSGRGHNVHYIAGETRRTDITNVHSMTKNLRVKFNGNGLSTPLPASKRRIDTFLSKENFDIIHVQVPYSPFMAAKVVSSAPDSTAVVGTFHILPYGRLSLIGNYLLGFWLQRNLRRFDAQIAVSKPAHLFAQKTFKINSQVIPNAVDTAQFKKASVAHRHKSEETIRIVFLGRLVERKGCMHLLKAIRELSEQGVRNFELHVYGKGRQQKQLSEFVETFKLDSIVKFHGYVDEAKKPQVLADADIAVFPSTAGESFGIVLIEAMASGSRVVIGGDNPGYRSVLNDDRALFNPEETDLFARTLKKFIENQELRDSVHKQQQITVRQYDIDHVGKKIEDIYNDCISLRRRG